MMNQWTEENGIQNQWTSTFRSYLGQRCSKIVHDLVAPDNNRENKDVLEGHLHIVIFWNMAIDRCGHTVAFEWISKRCTPPRLTAEQCCTWRTISYCHPLKHGYRQMSLHNCIEWMSERHPPRRLIVGQFVLKPNKHFTAWVWVIKATSLMRPRHFFSQSD